MAYKYKVKQITNNRSGDGQPYYGITLVSEYNLDLNKIAERVQAMSTHTVGDVLGVMKGVIEVMKDELSLGNTVTLDNLGTFSLSAELKRKITDPSTIRGNDIKVKRICFKPHPQFKRAIDFDTSFVQYAPAPKKNNQQ